MRNEKIFAGKTLAILSGGGDTPAINSSIEAVRNRASMLGFKVYGILRGWKGLLGDGDVVDLGCVAVTPCIVGVLGNGQITGLALA